MQFTDAQLHEFKVLYERNTGIALSNEDATTLAIQAIHVFKPILMPLVHEFLNDTDFLNDPNY